MDALYGFANGQGFGVSKLRSDKAKIVIKRDRGGRLISRVASGHEKNKISPRLIDCLFQLIARLRNDGS